MKPPAGANCKAVFILSSVLLAQRVSAKHQTSDCEKNVEQFNDRHTHHLRFCTARCGGKPPCKTFLPTAQSYQIKGAFVNRLLSHTCGICMRGNLNSIFYIPYMRDLCISSVDTSKTPRKSYIAARNNDSENKSKY